MTQVCQEGTGHGQRLAALCRSVAPGSPQASPTLGKGLCAQVPGDAGVSPVGHCAADGPAAPGMQSAQLLKGKERRNLGWVGTVGIYQYREFVTCYLLSHAHTHTDTHSPTPGTQHLPPGTGVQSLGPSVRNMMGRLPGESQTAAGHALQRSHPCSTHEAPSPSAQRPQGVVHPWAGAGRALEAPQRRWAFGRFLRPALAPRWAPFIRPLNCPCIFARFLEGGRSRRLG